VRPNPGSQGKCSATGSLWCITTKKPHHNPVPWLYGLLRLSGGYRS